MASETGKAQDQGVVKLSLQRALHIHKGSRHSFKPLTLTLHRQSLLSCSRHLKETTSLQQPITD